MRASSSQDRWREKRAQLSPIYAKAAALFKSAVLNTTSFSGSSPAPFVGRYGYPYINVGILSPPLLNPDAWLHDAPRYWAQKNFEIPQVVDLRSQLVNARFQSHVKHPHTLLSLSQEIGMASKPVDLEIELAKKPVFRPQFFRINAPLGPSIDLKRAILQSNPSISPKVDKVVDDIDLTAGDALLYLSRHHFDETFLSKLLSVGTLGLKKNRKLVPTRWAITATDDTLSKHHVQRLKEFPPWDYASYFGGYLGNYFLVLLFPDVWGFEIFETAIPKVPTPMAPFTTDHESYEGRKDYASEVTGGYYACRLAVTERLLQLKRQAAVLVLRFITDEYYNHLGVWVVREATRKALESRPLLFESGEKMLAHAAQLLQSKFGYRLPGLLPQSKLLTRIQTQKRLAQFL